MSNGRNGSTLNIQHLIAREMLNHRGTEVTEKTLCALCASVVI